MCNNTRLFGTNHCGHACKLTMEATLMGIHLAEVILCIRVNTGCDYMERTPKMHVYLCPG